MSKVRISERNAKQKPKFFAFISEQMEQRVPINSFNWPSRDIWRRSQRKYCFRISFSIRLQSWQKKHSKTKKYVNSIWRFVKQSYILFTFFLSDLWFVNIAFVARQQYNEAFVRKPHYEIMWQKRCSTISTAAWKGSPTPGPSPAGSGEAPALHAPKGQHHLAQGSALGDNATTSRHTPCRSALPLS